MCAVFCIERNWEREGERQKQSLMMHFDMKRICWISFCSFDTDVQYNYVVDHQPIGRLLFRLFCEHTNAHYHICNKFLDAVVRTLINFDSYYNVLWNLSLLMSPLQSQLVFIVSSCVDVEYCGTWYIYVCDVNHLVTSRRYMLRKDASFKLN